MTAHNKLSRREFLKGAAVAGSAAATAGVLGSITMEPAMAADSSPHWHKNPM